MSMINVASLTFSYENGSDNIFENVSFTIDTDWKLGFIGRNGRGKTTFLHILTGELEYSGNISADVDFEYFPYNVTDYLLSMMNASAIRFQIRKYCWESNLWR